MFGFGHKLETAIFSNESPPTLAPVLDVQSTLGSYEASLTWSASNRLSSPGFGYKVELDIDGGGFNEVVSTTNLFYTDTQGSATGETYTYRITPYNDYGEGPSSNEAGVVLPGEPEGPTLEGWGEGGGGTDLGFFYVVAVNLSWNEISGATSYSIYKVEDPPPFGVGTFTLLTTTTNLSYRDAAVTWPFGPVLQYKVAATNGAFSSDDSNILEFENLPMPPFVSKLELNAGGNILLNAGGAILIN